MAVPAPRRFLRACTTHHPKHTNKQAKLENGKIRIPFFNIWELGIWIKTAFFGWWRDWGRRHKLPGNGIVWVRSLKIPKFGILGKGIRNPSFFFLDLHYSFIRINERDRDRGI